MAKKNIIIPGDRINRLTFLFEEQKNGRGRRVGRFRCDCGTEKTIQIDIAVRGATKSCGCYHRERAAESNTTHGETVGREISRAYTTWASIKARCFNPRRKEYPDYGGRGITLCERWLKFENFLADMGEPPPGMSIDRYPDTNGDYEPGNCRWATRTEQNNNRRSCHYIEFNGKRQTVKQWADEIGLNEDTIRNRILKGVADPQELLRINTKEEQSRRKAWIITKPDGEELNILNLCSFCRENGLDPSTMNRIANGKRGMYSHKGFRVRPQTI